MGYNKGSQCLAQALLAAILLGVIAVLGYRSPIPALSWIAGVVCLVLLIIIGILCDICWQRPADSHIYTSLFRQYAMFTLFKIMGRKSLNVLLESSKKVSAQQEDILREIMTRQKNTVYGQKYGFGNISTRVEFKSKYPLTTYADYAEDIEKMVQGEENIITCDKTVYFATSSGTTGKNKIVPVTSLMKEKHQMMVGSLMYYLLHKRAGLQLGRSFVLTYRPKVEELPCGLQCGPITFHLSRYAPWSTAPAPVSQIEDEQAALYVHAVFALLEPEVTQLEPLMATVMYSFWRLVEARWKDICDDIEKGCIRELPNLSPSLLNEINEYVEPDPECAKFLREHFAKGFEGIAKRIWPKLRFVRMLSTGGFAHYAQILRDVYLSSVTQISQTHAASEGFYGVNVDYQSDETKYMPVLTFGMFEFIPEEYAGDDQPETFFMEQLEEGRNYEMVMTSPMGLYRYRTGDVIKVTGFLNQCPLYEFQHRLGQMLNLFWEKTSESVFYKSLTGAAEELEINVVDYTTTESIHLADHPECLSAAGEAKHYVLFVEIIQDGSSVRLSEEDTTVFDECLRENAELYSTLRGKNSISAMKVVQVKPGTFTQVRNLLLAESHNYQVKMPRAMRKKDVLDYLAARRLR